MLLSGIFMAGSVQASGGYGSGFINPLTCSGPWYDLVAVKDEADKKLYEQKVSWSNFRENQDAVDEALSELSIDGRSLTYHEKNEFLDYVIQRNYNYNMLNFDGESTKDYVKSVFEAYLRNKK